MPAYVLGFHEVDRTDVGIVGGKGANLGELSRLEGIARSRASIEALKREIRTKSGIELAKQSLTEPRSFAAILAGVNAANWINEHMLAWLGEKSAADTLAQAAPNNVTSEMGLALLDVADVIRRHPEVVAYLQHAREDGFLEGLLPLHGGRQAHDAIGAFLDEYGMRCAGEIDLTRTRWREAPTTLVPLILGNIKSFAPGRAAGGSNAGGRSPRTRNGSWWNACSSCQMGKKRPRKRNG